MKRYYWKLNTFLRFSKIEHHRRLMFIKHHRRKIRLGKVIWFNGISTLDGYLMPNPVYTYMIFK